MTALWESQILIRYLGSINSDTCFSPVSEYKARLFKISAPLLVITSIAGACISRARAFLDVAFLTGDMMSIFV